VLIELLKEIYFAFFRTASMPRHPYFFPAYPYMIPPQMFFPSDHMHPSVQVDDLGWDGACLVKNALTDFRPANAAKLFCGMNCFKSTQTESLQSF